MIDEATVDALTELAEELFLPKIQSDIGEGAEDYLEELMMAIREVHRALATERLTHGLTIGISMTSITPMIPGPPMMLTSASQLTGRHDSDMPLAIEVNRDGTFNCWKVPVDACPDGFLAYQFRGPSDEAFLTQANEHAVPKIPNQSSYFSVPYFRELRAALLHYDEQCARASNCEFLARSWRDEKRLIFLPGPEKLMRRSLQRFLRYSLRGVHSIAIMPEQNIDESHPVDLKVTWSSANRVALIEIKWLGWSAHSEAESTTAKWSKSRAVDGARQLSDYLDTYHQEVVGEEARGLLVLYDGRRRSLNLTTLSLREEDAVAFRDAEIDFSEFVGSRDDFDLPLRFFCSPVLS
jgi:hypothetical protein